MALHFSLDEYNQRIRKILNKMSEKNLDCLLMFSQESMYYLTGYDTFGFCFFQCLILNGDGRLVLLTRAPDLRQAQHTSIIDDIRIWVDRNGVKPTNDLKAILEEFGSQGKSIGVEYDSYGLNAHNGFAVAESLSGYCRATDASVLIKEVRTVKSEQEIAYVKKAATLADKALIAAEQNIYHGAYEGNILAALQGEVYRGGGESPGNENIIGSGDDALLCRSKSGRRHLDETDQITLEFAGVYHRYHAAMMRTICVGKANPEHQRMHAVAVEALKNCRERITPGNTMGDVFQAYADTCDKAGMKDHRLNATGYSLGAMFAPTWMDYPMFYKDNPYPIEARMTLFTHIILMNSESKTAMCLGETFLVTNSGNERLSNASNDLVVK